MEPRIYTDGPEGGARERVFVSGSSEDQLEVEHGEKRIFLTSMGCLTLFAVPIGGLALAGELLSRVSLQIERGAGLCLAGLALAVAGGGAWWWLRASERSGEAAGLLRFLLYVGSMLSFILATLLFGFALFG